MLVLGFNSDLGSKALKPSCSAGGLRPSINPFGFIDRIFSLRPDVAGLNARSPS